MSNRPIDPNAPQPAGKLRQQGTNPTPARVGNLHGDPASAGELSEAEVAEMVRREKEGRS